MPRLLTTTICTLAGLCAGALLTHRFAPLALGADQQEVTMEEFLEEITTRSKPASEHKLLEPLVGTFDQVTNFSIPGAPAMSIKGKGTNTLILGGRFLKMESASVAGEKLQLDTMSVMGFDHLRTRQFTGWSVDTMGTYAVSAAGSFDESIRTFTLIGESEEPGQGKMRLKWTVRVEEHRNTQEFYADIPGQGWTKLSEVISTRAK